MKMAELIAVSPSLPGVLTRMGIPFGFGDETVEEVCRRNGTDPETFLLICSVYAGDGSLPAKERIRKADLKDVLKYLRRSHAYYMEVAMQEITAALVALTEPCDERHRNIIRKFFNEYKEELFKHLEYEENTVFPQAEAALHNGRITPDDYEENHSHVEEKLEDLKNLVMKYMPPVCGQQDIYRALTCIFSLQEDLSRHILVEDGILVPIVNRRMHTELESRFDTPGEKGEELSAREKEILVCVAKGMLNKEIADAENISIHTVITHRKNITRKTGIKTYKEVLKFYPNFPIHGVNFVDIIPFLQDKGVFKELIDDIGKACASPNIVAPEARGFLFTAPLLYNGMAENVIPIRKKGKLPFSEGDLVAVDIVKEYGKDQVFYRISDLAAGKPEGDVIPITFFDDILATGGTARGIAESLNAQKVVIDGKEYRVKVTDFVFLVEIDDLPGRKVIEDLAPVKALIHVTEG